MKNEPTRQIHLDFHTSEHLPDIGLAFDREQFAASLTRGHVNLINVFAKCHHGWSYYPTRIGTPHPNLKTDLLGGQIEACHSAGIAAPVYFTVGWSAIDAENHPEWCMKTRDGGIVGAWDTTVGLEDPKPTFQWKSLCPSGEYHDLIIAHTEEILDAYEVDGMWYDIYQPHNLCWCETCRKRMRDAGLDETEPADVERQRAETIRSHCRAVRDLIVRKNPDASIYFNGLTALERPTNFRYRLFEFNTKNDLEDLPTTWGGYDKFPLRAKFFHREKKPIVAMSGKFHTSWGEFGGFKSPDAIKFEAASMIAFGSRCNFGDQLHPLGRMDEQTYENIAYAYEYIEKIEQYGIGGVPVATLGFVPSFELAADEGLARMLMEEQIDFDICLPGDDLSRFETIVIPSVAGLIDPLRSELEVFLGNGGRVVTLGDGILDADGTPALECGATYDGPGRFDMDFTAVTRVENRPRELPYTPFLNYSSALRFKPAPDSEMIAPVHEPYFSRTYAKYCGHQNSPFRPEPAGHPAAFRSENLTVFAHALDRMYYAHGAIAHRAFFASVLRPLHPSPMIDVALPSAGRVSLLHQPDEKRYVAHLLYGPPISRGRCSVIEDLVPIRNVRVRLVLPVEITSLTLVPDGTELQFERGTPAESVAGSRVAVEAIVPEFTGHCAVVARY